MCIVSIVATSPSHVATMLSLLNKDNWITYGNCAKMVFYIENNDICVNMEHYTHGKSIDYGMGCYGYEKVLEWEATIKLPMEFIENIKDDLNHKFNKFCDNAYEEYSDRKKLKWIDEFKKSILSNNNG